MSIDLGGAGEKFIDGTGGGTSGTDLFRQTAQIDQTNKGPIPVTVSPGPAGLGVTPVAGDGSTIATGGIAVALILGPCNGGYITNPLDAADQGLGSVENAYVDPVGSPGHIDGSGNGTTTTLSPGQSYTVPALAAGAEIRGNAASNGHKLTVVKW